MMMRVTHVNEPRSCFRFSLKNSLKTMATFRFSGFLVLLGCNQQSVMGYPCAFSPISRCSLRVKHVSGSGTGHINNAFPYVKRQEDGRADGHIHLLFFLLFPAKKQQQLWGMKIEKEKKKTWTWREKETRGSASCSSPLLCNSCNSCFDYSEGRKKNLQLR